MGKEFDVLEINRELVVLVSNESLVKLDDLSLALVGGGDIAVAY